MRNPEEYLKDLHRAYDTEIDTPSDIVSFRHDPPDESVPTEMDVLFWLPLKGPNEDQVTMLGTAGASSRKMAGPYPHLELAYEFDGGCEPERRRGMAKDLAELVTLPFREHKHYAPDMVLEGICLAPFERMSFAALAHWDVLAEVFLPGTDPPVLLVRIVPLFETEAALVEELGAARGLAWLRDKGMTAEDFTRGPVI